VGFALGGDRSHFWRLSARENLAFFTALHGQSGSEAVHSIERVLGIVHLEEDADRPVREYSTGMRQRLSVARGLLGQPRLLLMDEPTSGVSIEDKFQVMDTLVRVLKEGDITTIFVEHDMEVIQRYGERVLVFDTGRVIADGEPEQVFSDPEVKKTLLGQG